MLLKEAMGKLKLTYWKGDDKLSEKDIRVKAVQYASDTERPTRPFSPKDDFATFVNKFEKAFPGAAGGSV